jgi:hypothetical protein
LNDHHLFVPIIGRIYVIHKLSKNLACPESNLHHFALLALPVLHFFMKLGASCSSSSIESV